MRDIKLDHVAMGLMFFLWYVIYKDGVGIFKHIAKEENDFIVWGLTSLAFLWAFLCAIFFDSAIDFIKDQEAENE